jgi:hypothetical protein
MGTGTQHVNPNVAAMSHGDDADMALLGAAVSKAFQGMDVEGFAAKSTTGSAPLLTRRCPARISPADSRR